MKKNCLLVLFSVFALVLSNPSFAINKDELWGLLTFSDTPLSIEEARRIALENPSLLEEILFISDNEIDNAVARHNSLVNLETCSNVGIITKERFFNNVFRLLSQITTYVHPRELDGQKRWLIATLAFYGSSDSTPLAENFSTFPTLLNSMLTAGFIKNQGILNSLNKKIENAKAILDKRGDSAKNTAINKVQAAINELDAQRGKHIIEDGYQILSGYCKNLITKIQSTSL